MRAVFVAASILTAIAGSASAQSASRMTASPERAPDAQYAAIRNGMLSQAESGLMLAHVRHPDAPEVMLNLAAIHVKTGRAVLASSLYRKVLDHPPVAMDMPSGEVLSSHEVARRGMRVVDRS